MKFFVYLIFSVLILSGSIHAQSNEYKIRSKKRTITISHKNKPHSLALTDKIDAALITESKILFANRKADFLYLVIDVSGQSKTKQDDRQCGAGMESNLIWVKLDSAWKIVDSNSARYESCWSSTNSFDGYKITGNNLSIEIEDFRDKEAVILKYSNDQPEKGFQITPRASK